MVEGRVWPLVIVRHARARRYILRMTSDEGLRLTVPRRASIDAGLRFVQAQGNWIATERLRRQALTQHRGTTTTVLLRGVEVSQTEARAVALQELPARCLALAAQHGETVARVTIRNQRSRWGSCSTRRTIALNWRLVLMPSFVSDYIILHELMHLRQPNHSHDFWREVAGVCPDWREAERWLKRHGRRLL